MTLRKYIFPQRYVPGLRVSHLVFWLQYMSREIVRSGEASERGDDVYVTLRQCTLVFPNNQVLLVTTQIPNDDGGPFQADARMGLYEVMLIDREWSSPRGNQRDSDLQLILNEVAQLPNRRTAPKADRFQATCLPEIFYKPEIHGSFLYDDRHNFDAALVENRAMISHARMAKLLSETEASAGESPLDIVITTLNKWCTNNCRDEFAWTCFGPVWAFRDRDDAFNFRITWG